MHSTHSSRLRLACVRSAVFPASFENARESLGLPGRRHPLLGKAHGGCRGAGGRGPCGRLRGRPRRHVGRRRSGHLHRQAAQGGCECVHPPASALPTLGARRGLYGCVAHWELVPSTLPRTPRLTLSPFAADHPEIPDVTVEYDFSYNITVPARQVRFCSHRGSHAHSQPPASSSPPRLAAPRSAAYAPSRRPTSMCRPCAASLWTCC
jgi:hypothetical protein